MHKHESGPDYQYLEGQINNVVITNMPKAADYVGDFWKLVAKMDAKVEKNDVSSIEVVPKNTKSTSQKKLPNSQTILVKFSNYNAKGEMIKKKTKVGAILMEQITSKTNERQRAQSIYFRDHLTKFGLDLFSRCKTIQRQANLKFCWTKDGQMYLRKDESSKVIRVSSAKDISKLSNQFNLHQN